MVDGEIGRAMSKVCAAFGCSNKADQRHLLKRILFEIRITLYLNLNNPFQAA